MRSYLAAGARSTVACDGLGLPSVFEVLCFLFGSLAGLLRDGLGSRRSHQNLLGRSAREFCHCAWSLLLGSSVTVAVEGTATADRLNLVKAQIRKRWNSGPVWGTVACTSATCPNGVRLNSEPGRVLAPSHGRYGD